MDSVTRRKISVQSPGAVGDGLNGIRTQLAVETSPHESRQRRKAREEEDGFEVAEHDSARGQAGWKQVRRLISKHLDH